MVDENFEFLAFGIVMVDENFEFLAFGIVTCASVCLCMYVCV